jgi:hypothetical protein
MMMMMMMVIISEIEWPHFGYLLRAPPNRSHWEPSSQVKGGTRNDWRDFWPWRSVCPRPCLSLALIWLCTR